MKRIHSRPGTSPGLQAKAEEPPDPELMVRVICFDKDQLTETKMRLVDVPRPDPADQRTTWVRFSTMPDAASLAHFGERWGLHPLDLEDVINVGQRPKTEIRDGAAFTILQLPDLDEEGDFQPRQVNLFYGSNYVISIRQEGPPLFDAIVTRLHSGGRGRIRTSGAEYLFYALLDTTVDHGFAVLADMSQSIDDLEAEIVKGTSSESLDTLHYLRGSLTALRRSQWPAREAIDRLLKEEDSPVSKRIRGYLRDCLDHQMQMNDGIDVLRENVNGLQELFLSLQGHRLNDVMKVLTIIATIFIPLSFFTGLYGMNFNTELSPWNMPELNTRFGYPVLLLLLSGIAGGMVVFFKRRGWW